MFVLRLTTGRRALLLRQRQSTNTHLSGGGGGCHDAAITLTPHTSKYHKCRLSASLLDSFDKNVVLRFTEFECFLFDIAFVVESTIVHVQTFRARVYVACSNKVRKIRESNTNGSPEEYYFTLVLCCEEVGV